MLSEHFSAVQGVNNFALVSMILAIIFFIATLIWTIKLDKKYLTKMENLPLDTNIEHENNSEMKNEIN